MPNNTVPSLAAKPGTLMQPTIQAYGDRSKPDDAEESKTGGT